MNLKFAVASVWLAISSVVLAAPPAGYYDSLEGKNKGELKQAAKNVARRHSVVNYGDKTWEAFRQTDTRVVDGTLCWWDMYSPNNVSVSSGHPGMNIEHSVANSWWGGSKNDAYKDLFHLNPSDQKANSSKSNYPLGIVATVKYDNGITKVGQPASGQAGGSKWVYEPADCYKGDFARVFFYMFTIYDDISWQYDSSDRNYMFERGSYPTLRPWAYEMLLEWSRQDPVSQKEIDRNEAIYKIQGNRNPFIDAPYLAEYIWGDLKDGAFHYTGDFDPAPDPEPNPTPDPDPDPNPTPDPDPTPGVAGTWTPVLPDEAISPDEKYLIVSSGSSAVMSCTKSKSGNYIERSANDPVFNASGDIESIPSDAGVLTITPVDAAHYAIHVESPAGVPSGYLFSQTVKRIDFTDYATTDGVAARIEISAQGTDIIYGDGSPVAKLQYNASAPRFTTYTSNQERINLYRLVREPQGLELPAPSYYILDENGEETDGEFSSFALLELSYADEQFADAEIFYTTDGTDPEVTFTDGLPEAVAPALRYSAPLQIEQSCEVKAVGAMKGTASPVTAVALTRKNNDSETVEMLLADPSPDTELYTVSGIRVDISRRPAPGLYILRVGGRAIRVFIR